jgi:hypothetical protein
MEAPSAITGTFILLALLWTLPWKGVALWKAARNLHKAWFVVLFVVNTLAVLEILYIFVFSRGAGEPSPGA